MKRFIFVCLIVVICVARGDAQRKIKTLTLSEDVVYATVDRPGELYVISRTGQIQRFDVDGELLSLYKSGPGPTLFDPRDGARLFAYFRTDQHFAYLNPTFEITAAHSLDKSFAIDPWLICTSGDHNLWVLDAADKSLKKIDLTSSTVQAEVTVQQLSDHTVSAIVYMREYQGFLFLLDKEQGILVFNGLGKWLKTIGPKDIPYFNFIGEELYYPEAGKLKFFNLFSSEIREVNLSGTPSFALYTDERLFIVQNNTVEFFSISR